MKKALNISFMLLTAATLLTSCKETEVVSEYDNWQNRNAEYVDNLAAKCAVSENNGVTPDNAKSGEMFRLLSYLLDPESGNHRNIDYVYCEVIEHGEGTQTPHFTDSVWIDYRVRLIPTENYPEGMISDQSYRTEQIDRNLNTPSGFAISGLVPGVSTALMNMVSGDIWRLYIPYELGYGKSNHNNIPAYSTLIFDVCLEKFKLTYAE